MNGGNGMNGTTYAPGAARPDLARLMIWHMLEASRDGIAVGKHYCRSLQRETHPENFYAIGTDLRAEQHPCQLDAAADDAERVLRNHRRMAHCAWVRSMGDGDVDRANERAWMAARLHCGLPT